MSDAVISPSRLIAMLVPTLGRERAEKSVRGAVHALGLQGKEDWTHEEALKVLDAIAYAGGDAGVAAAQARARLVQRDAHGEAATTPSGMRRRAAADKRATYTRRDLAVMLARTLGQEKAAEVVADAARVLGLGQELSPADALRILERLAVAEGMVGVAARFAKTRVLLGS